MGLISKIQNKTVKIAVIGLGYVGLPTALIFASKEIPTYGVDINEEKIDLLRQNKSPINDQHIKNKLNSDNIVDYFHPTTNYKEIKNVDIFILTVPTPIDNYHQPNLTYIKNVGKMIQPLLDKNQLVILESTVYPGVTEEILLPILLESGLNSPEDFGLAYCPERLNPGDQSHQIENIVRVIGANSDKWANIASELYSIIQETHITVNIKTSEASKVIENIQRDLNIALMNELAMICEKINIDILEVLKAAFTKWNFNKYFPGPGVGGHCLPNDPYYLIQKAKELDYHAEIIASGRKVNDSMPKHVFNLLLKGLNDIKIPLKDTKILIMGASYKANVDDVRSSPSKSLIKEIEPFGSKITILEPNIETNNLFGHCNISNADNINFKNYKAIVIMVNHSEFNNIKWEKIINSNLKQIIIDGCRILGTKYKSYTKIIRLGGCNDIPK